MVGLSRKTVRKKGAKDDGDKYFQDTEGNGRVDRIKTILGKDI